MTIIFSNVGLAFILELIYARYRKNKEDLLVIGPDNPDLVQSLACTCLVPAALAVLEEPESVMMTDYDSAIPSTSQAGDPSTLFLLEPAESAEGTELVVMSMRKEFSQNRTRRQKFEEEFRHSMV